MRGPSRFSTRRIQTDPLPEFERARPDYDPIREGLESVKKLRERAAKAVGRRPAAALPVAPMMDGGGTKAAPKSRIPVRARDDAPTEQSSLEELWGAVEELRALANDTRAKVLAPAPDAPRAALIQKNGEVILDPTAPVNAKRQAITSAAGLAEAAQLAVPAKWKATREPLTIAAAAHQHPATVKEHAGSGLAIKQHEDGLARFLAHSGLEKLADLRAAHVTAFIEHLRRSGHPYDTRRHWLLWVRRACAIGARQGIPDQLAGWKLDRKEARAESETLTLVQLCTAIRDTRRGDDPRVPAALALMGLCGLGPSEAIRLNVGDLADGILRVGIQGAKNEARRRRLPLPATVRQLCLPLLDGREASAPLFVYGRLRGNSRMSLVKLAHVFAGAGVGVSPKILRKSFATIAIWELGIDTRHVEAFMGHTISGLAAVTNRAYLSLASVQALRPTALRIDDEVTKHLPDLAEHWDWSI